MHIIQYSSTILLYIVDGAGLHLISFAKIKLLKSHNTTMAPWQHWLSSALKAGFDIATNHPTNTTGVLTGDGGHQYLRLLLGSQQGNTF